VKTVLVVDDNSYIRIGLRMFLEANDDLEVCGEAASGEEAIAKAESLKPQLVIMDLAMPKMSGAEAAYAIKRAMPETKVVMFSLYPDPARKDLANSLGVDLVVSKVDGVAGLMDTLRQLMCDHEFRKELDQTSEAAEEGAGSPLLHRLS
jgi:two-component system, NarL family, vancomycin resistance associated response regulator VraR